ncbi:MAG: phosphoribosylformylglycinamidine cyclo-ligase, partial [Mycobacterium sp.]|nr:phosphoribosylformylglycinamidine cyclo-ligase [Mycobacterium sp.]
MVGHIPTPSPIARGDRRESVQYRPVTAAQATTVALLSMTDQAEQHGISYASAGVDIEAGDRAVELFKPLAK